jgi:DNA (cytosine-5)-methyltransferase 1
VKARRLTRRRKLCFIDLFCGGGGFTLGMQRAGFRCVAAIDSNHEAIDVFGANFRSVAHALQKDLRKFGPAELEALIGSLTIDVIVGGPPCQGFSTARQVDWANHGSRVKRDKRRYLYREFLEYVRHFRPRVFVMENVLGIQTAAKGAIFTRLQAEARSIGYRVHPQVEEAWKLGVPQKRRRQLIVGVRNDVPGYFPANLLPSKRAGLKANAKQHLTLWDAIGDLPRLPAGGGSEDHSYDLGRRRVFLKSRGVRAANYLNKVLEITRAKRLTAHQARPHNEQDLRDFARLHEGEHSAEAIARGEPMEFTYKREIFKDRFKRQHREQLCSTIVAHLSKDGLMFIHPTQNRSLTAREAARVQSFPDWFVFPIPRTHQFRLVGNAVPPLVAEAVGEQITAFLKRSERRHTQAARARSRVPFDPREALSWLSPVLDKTRFALRRVSIDELKNAWCAVAFLYPQLHPAAALDHGQWICRNSVNGHSNLAAPGDDLATAYFERSGWPVMLAALASEARCRYQRRELKEQEYYCVEAQTAGISFRTLHVQTGNSSAG